MVLSHLYLVDYESLVAKFETFLARAASFQTLSFRVGPSTQKASASQSTGASIIKKQLVLIEDIPNMAQATVRDAFHAALVSFISSAEVPCPIVLIVSDSGLRGEAKDEQGAYGGYASRDEAFNIRTIIPPQVLHSPYFTQIACAHSTRAQLYSN